MYGLSAPDRRPDWRFLTQHEHRLVALEELVDQAVVAVRPSDEGWCANAFFGRAIKPLGSLLVGDDRGYPIEEARPRTDEVTTFGDLIDEDDDRAPATTDEERVLRSSEAYDAALSHLLSKLPACRNCSCI